jgi:thiamine biosynthesis lipoprotein
MTTHISRRRILSMGLLAAGALACPRALTAWAGSPRRATYRRPLWAMGGWNHLEAVADSPEVGEAALSAMADAIRRIDRSFSVFDARTPLSRFNAADALTVAIDDPVMLDAIDRSLRWSAALEGLFDPTVERLMKRWGFRDESAGVICPPADQRDWNYRAVECDVRGGVIRRESARLAIDSGGWAKGVAAEAAANAGLHAGAVEARANCGGDIFRAAKDDEPWTCAIRDPRGRRTEPLLNVRHRFRTAATSAIYETYRVDASGCRHGHLMDPRCGAPSASDLLSVTVFANDGLMADATSSGLYIMGLTDAVRWLNGRQDAAAVLIHRDHTGGLSGVRVIGPLEVEPV